MIAEVKTTISISMVRQWNLKSGDKLDWSWESGNNTMVMVVRKSTPLETKNNDKK